MVWHWPASAPCAEVPSPRLFACIRSATLHACLPVWLNRLKLDQCRSNRAHHTGSHVACRHELRTTASVSHMQARAHTCVGCSVACLATSFFLAHGVLPRDAFGPIATAASRLGSHDARRSNHDPPPIVTRPPSPLPVANAGPGTRIRPLAGSHRGPTSTPLNLPAAAQGPCRRSLARRAAREIHHGRATPGPLTLAAARVT